MMVRAYRQRFIDGIVLFDQFGAQCYGRRRDGSSQRVFGKPDHVVRENMSKRLDCPQIRKWVVCRIGQRALHDDNLVVPLTGDGVDSFFYFPDRGSAGGKENWELAFCDMGKVRQVR